MKIYFCQKSYEYSYITGYEAVKESSQTKRKEWGFRLMLPLLLYLQNMKKVSLYLMTLLYVLAGINHFYNTPFYEAIMPVYIGYHTTLIYISGVCEIALGLLLLPKYTRKIAANLIILMLVVFLWIHVQMFIDYWHNHDKNLWVAAVRLPMQFVLIYWAFTFTKPAK